MVFVFFTNTSDTTALHSMNPTTHVNNHFFLTFQNLIDHHLTTLTQDTSPFRRALHQQFQEHLEQQPHTLQQYTTHQQQLIQQLAGQLPPNSNPNPNSDTDPNPNPNPNQPSPPSRRRRYRYYAVRKGRKLGIFTSWDECRLQVEGIANKFKGLINLPDALSYLDPPHSSSGPE